MDLLVIFLGIIIIIYLLVAKDLDFKHNKAGIRLNIIKRPKHDNYLVGFYLGYLKGIKTGNVLLELEESNLRLRIENRDGLQDIVLKKDDIVNYKVKIDAYHTQRDMIKNHDINCSDSYFASCPIGDDNVYETGKTLKIRKAYFIEFILKNKVKIEIIFFNNPHFLVKFIDKENI